MEHVSVDILKLLQEGNVIQIKPQGYSMYPMIIPGRDSAIIQQVDVKSLKRGDVVLYRRDKSILVLHRIWKIHKTGLYMVGDNQTKIEGPLQGDQVKGVLVGFVRNGKEVSTSNLIYVVISRLWLILRPFRHMITKPVAFLKKSIL